jgi:hypothetical protein
MLKDMWGNKCFFQVKISHVLHFISVTYLLTLPRNCDPQETKCLSATYTQKVKWAVIILFKFVTAYEILHVSLWNATAAVLLYMQQCFDCLWCLTSSLNTLGQALDIIKEDIICEMNAIWMTKEFTVGGGQCIFVPTRKTASSVGQCVHYEINVLKKLHGLSPQVNYTHRATAACRRS